MPQIQPMNWLCLLYITNFISFLLMAVIYFSVSGLMTSSGGLEPLLEKKSWHFMW